MSFQSRHVYTREERMLLEASFTRQSHPDINEKERLAKLLNCNIIQISNWFQNHRRRVKKQTKSVVPNASTTTGNYQTTSTYHQPNCPFNDNYYYYSSPPQYVYSPEPFYTQTVYYDSFIPYEQ